jgi:hypothetical protein
MDIFPTRVVIAVSSDWVWLPILVAVAFAVWKFLKVLIASRS